MDIWILFVPFLMLLRCLCVCRRQGLRRAGDEAPLLMWTFQRYIPPLSCLGSSQAGISMNVILSEIVMGAGSL